MDFSSVFSFVRYFYLFRLSYMYSAFIGFLLTFTIGLALSYLLHAIGKQGRERIYIDETRTIINADLFLPPIAKSIRRRNAAHEQKPKEEIEIEKY